MGLIKDKRTLACKRSTEQCKRITLVHGNIYSPHIYTNTDEGYQNLLGVMYLDLLRRADNSTGCLNSDRALAKKKSNVKIYIIIILFS